MIKPHQFIASGASRSAVPGRRRHRRQIERLMLRKTAGMVSVRDSSFGGFLGLGADFSALCLGKLRYNTTCEAYEIDIE